MVAMKSYQEELALEKQLAKCVSDIKEVTNGSMMARMTLLRHLRSQNYDVKKAESALRKYWEFKNERNLHDIAKRMEEVSKSLKGIFHMERICTDLEGRPVIYQVISKWKFDEIASRPNGIADAQNMVFLTQEKGLQSLVKLNEALPDGKNLVTDFLVISEYNGIGFSTFASLKAIKILASLASVNNLFLDVPIAFHINTPRLISPVKNIAVGDHSKMHFIGKQASWEKELRKFADFKKLEPFVGKSVLVK